MCSARVSASFIKRLSRRGTNSLLSRVSNAISLGWMNSFSFPASSSVSTPTATNCFKYSEAVWRLAIPASVRLLMRQYGN